jgi:hypothetical protein
MIIAIIITVVLCAVGLFYVAVRDRRSQSKNKFRNVDLNAFRVLMDRDDERFMKKSLPHSRFSRLKRQRIRILMRYVARIASNASAVMQMSEPARTNAVPEVAQAAAQLTELATQIRLQCLVALAKLSVEYAVPALQLTPSVLAPKYQSLRDNLRILGDLQTKSASPLPAAI